MRILRPRYRHQALPTDGTTGEVGPSRLGHDLLELVARWLTGRAHRRLAAACRVGCLVANRLPAGRPLPTGPVCVDYDARRVVIRTALCPLTATAHEADRDHAGDATDETYGTREITRGRRSVEIQWVTDLGCGVLTADAPLKWADRITWPVHVISDTGVLPAPTSSVQLCIGELSCKTMLAGVTRLVLMMPSYRPIHMFQNLAHLEVPDLLDLVLAAREGDGIGEVTERKIIGWLAPRCPGLRSIEGARRRNVPAGVEWRRRTTRWSKFADAWTRRRVPDLF